MIDNHLHKGCDVLQPVNLRGTGMTFFNTHVGVLSQVGEHSILDKSKGLMAAESWNSRFALQPKVLKRWMTNSGEKKALLYI